MFSSNRRGAEVNGLLMKKMDAADVVKFAKWVALDVRGLDISAGFPVGAIILAPALKEYCGDEALTGA